MRRPVASVLAAVVGIGLLAAPASSASATKAPARSGKASPAAFMRSHGTRPVSVARASGVPSAQPIAHSHLDPRAAQQQPTARGVVRVAVTGNAAVVSTSAARVGGRVLASAGGTSSVLVPRAQLAALAAAPGIAAVNAPERPRALAAPASEGVAASGADTWHAALPSQTGAGVHIAIVDVGFGTSATEYSDAVTAGDLGANPQLTNETCTDNANNSTPYVDGHGLAVAELAHQEAPDAVLDLYCIGDITGLVTAETAIEGAQIKIASSSLGWYGDSRGDGTGPAQSAAAVVAKARKAGVLWIQSAGNDAADHWGRVMGDADHDHFLDINGPFNQAKNIFEDDFVYVAGTTGGVPTSAAVYLQWDQWPTTTAAVTLQLYGYQCNMPFGSGGIDGCQATAINPDANDNPRPLSDPHVSGTTPVVAVDTSTFANVSQFDQVWEVVATDSGTFPTVRYDFNYLGDLDGVSDNDCPTVVNNACVLPVDGFSHSITAPANSPYVLAVGAADVGVDGTAKGTREFFSSQGPTIDGRVKPDITGWDGVSSAVYGVPSTDPNAPGGFYGTSAAAPSVAGAAALVAAADPTLDAAQLQSFLESRAGSGAPKNPPTNALGHGLLTLGAASGIAAPAGANYTPITPTRILDTRTATGGHKAVLAAGGTATIAVAAGVPADATAVAVNLTGVGASAATYLSTYTGGTAWPGTSNLNLSKVDATAAVFAVVSLKAGAKTITVRNSAGTVNAVVDELGYFSPGTGTGRYTALAAPHRVLDTRTTTGGHHGLLSGTGTVHVAAGVPSGASAAIVNVTVTNATGGHVNAAPTCSNTSSTLNYGKYARANLAVVKLDSTGTFCISNSGSTINVIVDVLGYMSDNGAQYFALPSAQRIVDTRTGNGGSAGGHASRALGAATSTAFYGSNVGHVPASATALLTGAIEASTTAASGYLSFFPGATKPATAASTMNFSTGRVVANAAIVGVAGKQFGVYNVTGSTHAVVDLFGYFN